MSADDDVITLQLLWSFDEERRELVVTGHPTDDAMLAVLGAINLQYPYGLDELKHYDKVPFSEPLLALNAEHDPVDDEDYVLDFINLYPRTTYAELALLIGPQPFSASVTLMGFGGDGMEPMVIWILDDLIPFGRDALEVFGAAEVARRIGRALRRRRHRELRESVDNWIREGGRVPEDVREVVERSFSWSEPKIDAWFGITGRDARKLMKRCGYRWSRKRRCYFARGHEDAVN